MFAISCFIKSFKSDRLLIIHVNVEVKVSPKLDIHRSQVSLSWRTQTRKIALHNTFTKILFQDPVNLLHVKVYHLASKLSHLVHFTEAILIFNNFEAWLYSERLLKKHVTKLTDVTFSRKYGSRTTISVMSHHTIS